MGRNVVGVLIPFEAFRLIYNLVSRCGLKNEPFGLELNTERSIIFHFIGRVL